MERNRPPALGPDESQKIFRRAAELDREHARPPSLRADEPRIDRAELQRIAVESGLSEEAVRRALDELQGGGLPGGRKAPCTAKRIFEEPAARIEERITDAMLRNGLSPVHTAPHATQWLPAPGFGRSISRVLDIGGKGAFLGATVESSVYAVAGERTSAELRGRAADMTTPVATVAGFLLAFPAGIALLVLLALGLSHGAPMEHGLAMLIVAAIWAAATLLVTRGVTRGRTRKLQRALERTLRQLSA